MKYSTIDHTTGNTWDTDDKIAALDLMNVLESADRHITVWDNEKELKIGDTDFEWNPESK